VEDVWFVVELMRRRNFLDGEGRVSVVIQVSLVGQGVWDFPIMSEKASFSEASFFI